VLLDPGDVVICGAPSYFVYLGTLANLGARPVGVETDEHGLIPDSVEATLCRLDAAGELARVKAIYVTTSFDNPTGVTLSLDRRAQLVELAERWSRHGKIHLIEDAAYRELRYRGRDLPSLWSLDAGGDTVIHAGTFSKSFSPGIRVGWGVLPPHLLEPVLAAKGTLDFGSPNFNQVVMAAVIQQGLFESHVEALRRGYRGKLDAMLDALTEFMAPRDGVQWFRPEGGLYVWLRLPDGIDTGLSGRLFDRAVEEGVLYVPGRYCYPNEGPPAPDNMIRLSFGIQSPAAIRRGVESLARAVRQVI
jgi:2-aminoadipate transaminase